jgi:hypothetical protein
LGGYIFQTTTPNAKISIDMSLKGLHYATLKSPVILTLWIFNFLFLFLQNCNGPLGFTTREPLLPLSPQKSRTLKVNNVATTYTPHGLFQGP